MLEKKMTRRGTLGLLAALPAAGCVVVDPGAGGGGGGGGGGGTPTPQINLQPGQYGGSGRGLNILQVRFGEGSIVTREFDPSNVFMPFGPQTTYRHVGRNNYVAVSGPGATNLTVHSATSFTAGGTTYSR